MCHRTICTLLNVSVFSQQFILISHTKCFFSFLWFRILHIFIFCCWGFVCFFLFCISFAVTATNKPCLLLQPLFGDSTKVFSNNFFLSFFKKREWRTLDRYITVQKKITGKTNVFDVQKIKIKMILMRLKPIHMMSMFTL